MNSYQHIRLEANGNLVVVHLCDQRLIDSTVISELQTELLSAVFDLKPKRMIISFAAVRRILTEVISVLLFVREQVLQDNGRLSLCDMQWPIREIFTLLHLDFEIHDTISASETCVPMVTKELSESK